MRTVLVRIEGILRWAVLVFCASSLRAMGQDRPVHWLNAGVMPPGAIGSQRLHRGGPLSGYFQPVRIRAPEGARIALASEGSYSPAQRPGASSRGAQSNEGLLGMQIGFVYRLQVTRIPNNEGVDIYPTVELIDRLYPPQ